MQRATPIATIVLSTALALAIAPRAAQAAEVIVLTQTPCQFLEVEDDHGYTTKRKADCERINKETGTDRLAKAKVLELTPGDYLFRVTNKNVPYSLGFWIREQDYNWANPPSNT